jgi:hypothetical protein
MYVREAFPDWRAPTEDQTPFAATLRMEQGYDLPVQVRIDPSTNGDRSIVAVRDARALLAGREARTRSPRPRPSSGASSSRSPPSSTQTTAT